MPARPPCAGDRFEETTAEVQPADQGVDLGHAGEATGVVHDVHRAGVAAAGQHDEAASRDVDDDRLVVPDPRVGFPAVVPPGLLPWQAALEVGHSLRLAQIGRASCRERV